jgi:serine/threonine-protein kinase
LAGESEVANRFMREIKLLASLDHPNIAALHTALRLNNQLLMVMEFVEGVTLDSKLQQGPLPVPEAVNAISQVLSALSYAHERGVIHRDIKPPNMMLTPNGTVKLMDFGIAKAAADRRLTMTGTTLGSLYYMSPEQVKGSADLDGRSDLYSVGVALYELVTGTRPFKGDSDYSVMVAHLEQQPQPPIQVTPSLPPALNEIILTAIEKDPAARFQTAKAFRAALDSVAGVKPQPAPAPVPQLAPPPSRPSSRRGLYMALGAVAAILVLVLAATQLPRFFKAGAKSTLQTQQQETPVQTTQPPPPTETATPPKESATTPLAPPAEIQPPPTGASTGASRTQPTAPKSRTVSPPPQRTQAAEAPPTQATQPPPPTQPPRETAPPTQAADAADREALAQLRERMVFLASRANALRSSLQNLEQQQRASGLSMRTDISASWKRMEFLLDESEAALKARDVTAAKRNLDLAEREVDRLDQFLGH